MSTATLTLTLGAKKAPAPKPVEIKDTDDENTVTKKLALRKAALAKAPKPPGKTLVLTLAKLEGAVLVSTSEWTYRIPQKGLGGYNPGYAALILGGDPTITKVDLVIDGTPFPTKKTGLDDLLEIFVYVHAKV